MACDRMGLCRLSCHVRWGFFLLFDNANEKQNKTKPHTKMQRNNLQAKFKVIFMGSRFFLFPLCKHVHLDCKRYMPLCSDGRHSAILSRIWGPFIPSSNWYSSFVSFSGAYALPCKWLN